MTQLLEITDDVVSGDVGTGESINLLTSSIKLRAEGWTAIGSTGNDRVWETIELVGVDDDADLVELSNKLDRLLQLARDYDRVKSVNREVLLWWQAGDASSGEGSSKVARIYDGKTEIRSEGWYDPILGHDALFLTLAILRGPWERSAGHSVSSGAPFSAEGGKWLVDPSYNNRSSLPAPIPKFDLTTPDVAVMQRFWIGIKDMHGGTAQYTSKWECELGAASTNTTAVADATASGGSIMRTAFVTTAMTKRFEIGVNTIGFGTAETWLGSYLVLGRLKVNSGTTTVGVQLRQGLIGIGGMDEICSTTYITGQNSYSLFELGNIEIPPTGYQVYDSANLNSVVKNFSMNIYAELISGTPGTLYMDCLYLVPTDHLFTAGSATVAATPTGGTLRAITNTRKENFAVCSTGAADTWGNVIYSFENWNYPVDGGMVVVVGAGATAHVLSETVNANMTIVPSYASLKGTTS